MRRETEDGLVGRREHAAEFGRVARPFACRQRAGPGEHVDIGVVGDCDAHFRGIGIGRGNAGIERVLQRQFGRHEVPDTGLRRGAEFRCADRAHVFDVIVKEIDRAARRRQPADARAFRQTAALEGELHFHHVVEARHDGNAITLAHGREDVVIAGYRAGVRLRGLARFLRFAALDHDDRLACEERLGGRRHECRRPPYPFDEQSDDACMFVLDEEVDVIGEIEADLVAARYHIAEIDAAIGARFDEEPQRAARLRYEGDGTRRKLADFVVGIAEEPLVQSIAAHAIGAGDDQPALVDEGLEGASARDDFGIAAFTDIAGIDGRALQSCGDAHLEHVLHRRCRNNDDRMFHRHRQPREIGIAGHAIDFAEARIDRKNLAAIAVRPQIVENLPRPAGTFGCTDDRDRGRIENRRGRLEHHVIRRSLRKPLQHFPLLSLICRTASQHRRWPAQIKRKLVGPLACCRAALRGRSFSARPPDGRIATVESSRGNLSSMLFAIGPRHLESGPLAAETRTVARRSVTMALGSIKFKGSRRAARRRSGERYGQKVHQNVSGHRGPLWQTRRISTAVPRRRYGMINGVCGMKVARVSGVPAARCRDHPATGCRWRDECAACCPAPRGNVRGGGVAHMCGVVDPFDDVRQIVKSGRDGLIWIQYLVGFRNIFVRS